jgi:uncharacterized repeat protein (TIGR03803 family)
LASRKTEQEKAMKILRVLLVTVLVVVAGRTFNANAQTETNLHSFAGRPSDGRNPSAGLVQGTDSNFYGTTSDGGANGDGTVFQISPSGSYTNLYSFAGHPNDGANPYAGLVQGTDSNFYGTTSDGGANGDGTVFQISPSGSYTNLYSFAGHPNDGANPYAGLVQGADSNFYGTTLYGGTSTNCDAGCGTVFQISPSGNYTNLYSFAGSPNDGSYPQAGLVQGSDSNFYGTTSGGGTNDNGTVFRISPSGSYTNLYSFAGSPNDGKNPSAGLVQGTDGNFYGTTFSGGTNDNGTVFRISPSGSYTNLYSFAGSPNDGSYPQAGLVQGTDSNFYGTTLYGGTNGDGTVFELTLGGNTNCTFSISSTNALFDAAGGSNSVSVIASNGCTWTANNNNSFITIDSGSPGTGTGTVYYSVAANTTTNILTGTMTIAGQTFTVTQSGASTVGNCTFTLTTTNVTLAAKGGSKNVRVKVQGTNCSWTAVSNNPFITITSGSSGTGNGKVVYTVPGNTNTTALTGTMTIAGQTVTVKQAAGGCTFKLSPKDAKFKAAAAPATVKVKPNLSDCAWTAVSNDSFITIYDGGSSVGKGTVSYFITPNTNSVARTGSMIIGGQTVTVTQSAEK